MAQLGKEGTWGGSQGVNSGKLGAEQGTGWRDTILSEINRELNYGKASLITEILITECDSESSGKRVLCEFAVKHQAAEYQGRRIEPSATEEPKFRFQLSLVERSWTSFFNSSSQNYSHP